MSTKPHDRNGRGVFCFDAFSIGTQPGKNHAGGLGILEFEDTAERGRAWDFYGACERGAGFEGATGKHQSESKSGGDLFGTLYSKPERLKEFLSAMTGVSLPAANAIARKFEWSQYKTFTDIGAAQGGLPVQVALAHPHLQGTGYDLPTVKPIFEEYVASFGLSQRLKFCAGDFFKENFPSTDVIVMGHILHDWDLETKRMLIAKAYKALPKGGAFLVFEALIDDDRSQNAFGLLMSLNMLLETPGGFDYTGADCQGWMKDTGFRETRVTHLTGPDSTVIGIK